MADRPVSVAGLSDVVRRDVVVLSGDRYRQGMRSLERGGEGTGPAPGPVDLESDASSASDEPGGDVQQPVAKGSGFGSGEVGLIMQEQVLGPGEQVDADQGMPSRLG